MSPLSTFLDGATPAEARGLLFLSLSDTGHVIAETFASDSGGGGSITYTAGSALPCRIDPVASRRSSDLTGGRIDERTTHVVTLPPATSVNAGQQFAIDGRGTFEITATRERTREWARVIEVVAV